MTDEEEEEEYIVEAIRGWRYNISKNRKEWLIKWKDYDESTNTWEPKEHLECPVVLREYEKSLSKEQKRFYFASDPSKLTGFQRNATYKRWVASDGPHDSDSEDSTTKDPEKKQKFYVLIIFEDSDDIAEEITMKEFFKHKPKEAFEFIECRLQLKKSSDHNRSQASHF